MKSITLGQDLVYLPPYPSWSWIDYLDVFIRKMENFMENIFAHTGRKDEYIDHT